MSSSSLSTRQHTLANAPVSHARWASVKSSKDTEPDSCKRRHMNDIEAWAPWAICLPRRIFRSCRMTITCLILFGSSVILPYPSMIVPVINPHGLADRLLKTTLLVERHSSFVSNHGVLMKAFVALHQPGH